CWPDDTWGLRIVVRHNEWCCGSSPRGRWCVVLRGADRSSTDSLTLGRHFLRLCLTGDTLLGMSEVSVRDLRNRGGRVIDQVARGERVTVTRDGKPVAELRPYLQSKLSAEALLARWRHLPIVDPGALRNDVDKLLNSRT